MKKKILGDDKEWFYKKYNEILLMVENYDSSPIKEKKVIDVLHEIFDNGYSLGYNTAQQEFKEKDKMKTYRIRSGDLDCTVGAEDKNAAAHKALKEKNPKSLGVIIEIWEVPNGEPYYMSTEKVLKNLGIWSDEKE